MLLGLLQFAVHGHSVDYLAEKGDYFAEEPSAGQKVGQAVEFVIVVRAHVNDVQDEHGEPNHFGEVGQVFWKVLQRLILRLNERLAQHTVHCSDVH